MSKTYNYDLFCISRYVLQFVEFAEKVSSMPPVVVMLRLLKIYSFETFENKKNNQKLLSKLIMHSNIDKTVKTVLK